MTTYRKTTLYYEMALENIIKDAPNLSKEEIIRILETILND